MTASLQEMAQLTLHRAIEADALLAFRQSFPSESRPSINDLVHAAIARALTRHPSVNATLEEDTIRRWRAVHLGMAVALDKGLVVPVIRNAHAMSLAELHDEAARLAERARQGQLSMEEIQGGTFTVSNLGAAGVDAFTPIINPPQVAILGLGRIYRASMTLSLSIDHRALDGYPGAQFLNEMAQLLEHPEAILA